MATLCYAYRLSPEAYWNLTLGEHRALVTLLKEMAKDRKKRKRG